MTDQSTQMIYYGDLDDPDEAYRGLRDGELQCPKCGAWSPVLDQLQIVYGEECLHEVRTCGDPDCTCSDQVFQCRHCRAVLPATELPGDREIAWRPAAQHTTASVRSG